MDWRVVVASRRSDLCARWRAKVISLLANDAAHCFNCLPSSYCQIFCLHEDHHQCFSSLANGS